MRKLKFSEIKELKDILDKFPDSDGTDAVLFFPIDMDNANAEEDESGMMLFTQSVAVKSGANTLLTFGLTTSDKGNCDSIAAAYYDKTAAVILDMQEYVQVLKYFNPDFDFSKILDLECRLIMKKNILLRYPASLV